MNRWLILAVAAAACGGADTEPDPSLTAPYIAPEGDEPEADVDLVEVGDAVQGALDGLWTLNAAPVLQGYRTAIAGQTATCPRTYTTDGNVYWFDTCTTDAGSTFSGYGFYYLLQDYAISPEWRGYYEVLKGAARIETADGLAMDVAGGVGLVSAVHRTEPAALYQSQVQGTFAWDGPEADGTWLADGLSPDLTLQVYERTDTGGRLLTINGGLGGASPPFTALVFDQVNLIEGSLGGMCPQEPDGVISARTADGAWIDLIFDGPDLETFRSDPAACDGTGRAYYRGALLGDITIDFSTLYELQGAPW